MYATTLLSIICTVSTMKSAVSAATFDQSQTGDLNVQVDLKGLHIIALMKGGKEEYVDYDYAYDYSEMTIKPQNGQNSTTSKPALSTTNSTNATSTSFSSEEPSTLATTIMSSTTDLGTTTMKDSLGSSPSTDLGTTTLKDSLGSSPSMDLGSTTLKASLESLPSVDLGTTTLKDSLGSLPSVDLETSTLKDSLASSPSDLTAAPYSETSTVTESKTTTREPIVCKKGFVLNQKGECELRQNPTTNAYHVPFEPWVLGLIPDGGNLGNELFQSADQSWVLFRLLKLVKLSQKLKLRRERGHVADNEDV